MDGWIRKPPLVKAQTALITKKIKLNMAKMTFKMVYGILTPCNVARGSGMTCH